MPVIGLVPALAGIWLLFSLGPKFKIVKRQESGSACRYGIFLMGDLLICYSWFDTTVIPRPHFKGLKDGAVQYQYQGEVKSFDLPAAVVGKDRQSLEAALATWAA